MQALVISHPGSAGSLEAGSPQEIEREFDERLRDSASLAFRVALGVLRNRADAEDVAQEAFLRAYRSFHRLRDRERFRGWLARIAWRLAIDRLRAAARRELREQAGLEVARAQTVEDVAGAREFRARLHAAVQELPRRLRQVLILAAIQGYNTAETALLLGISEGTVKSRLYVARRRLVEKLAWAAENSEMT